MTDPTLCQPLRLAEPITGGPFRRGGRVRQPLVGAQFKVTTASGELVPDNEGLTSSNGLYTTDRNGQIVLSKLLPGTYVVAEEKAPDNYRKDPYFSIIRPPFLVLVTITVWVSPLAPITTLVLGESITYPDGALRKAKQFP